MAYTHLGAALPLAPSKPTTLAPAVKPVVVKPPAKPSTLPAKAAPATAKRVVKQPPAPLPPRPKTLTQKEAVERLVKLIARENTIRAGIADLLKQVKAASDKVTATALALKAASTEAQQSRAKALRSPVPGVAKAAAAKAAKAAREAAAAAADLKALKAGLLVWQKALAVAIVQTKTERAATAAMSPSIAVTLPPAPTSKPEVLAADKQAAAVTAQVSKDVAQAAATVVEETKKIAEETKQTAPETAADLKAAIDEVKEPIEGGEAESNSSGGDGSKLGKLPLLAAAAAAGLWFLTRKRSA